MRADFFGTSFIRSRAGGWWCWHIMPDRLWVSWRYYEGQRGLRIHWKSR
jgi:hypothetical protein